MQNRKPSAISIGKLAECVQGEFLNCPEKSDELVESLMVGAMCVDPTPLYFGIKSDKAVITRGDRADIQLGALMTSTKCLICTGGIKPISSVMQRAEDLKVPVILVSKDTPATLNDLEQGLGQAIVETPAADDESTEPVDSSES